MKSKAGLVTGDTEDITNYVRRFAPEANGGLPGRQTELDLVVSTDVLAEGLNLQDANQVLNYDLHWKPGAIDPAFRSNRPHWFPT